MERVTNVARNCVEDAETATKQQQDDMRYPEKARMTTTKLETTFEEMVKAIGNSLSDLASSNDEEDGEDKDDDEDDPAGGNLSEHDEPGWVMAQYLMWYSIGWSKFGRRRRSSMN
jgi:hypothetical protein